MKLALITLISIVYLSCIISLRSTKRFEKHGNPEFQTFDGISKKDVKLNHVYKISFSQTCSEVDIETNDKCIKVKSESRNDLMVVPFKITEFSCKKDDKKEIQVDVFCNHKKVIHSKYDDKKLKMITYKGTFSFTK